MPADTPAVVCSVRDRAVRRILAEIESGRVLSRGAITSFGGRQKYLRGQGHTSGKSHRRAWHSHHQYLAWRAAARTQ